MTPRTAQPLLVVWGALASVAVLVGMVRADVLTTLGPSWAASFVVTTAAGAWAVRSQPGNAGALRLLVYGCVALTWLAVSVELVHHVRVGGGGASFVVLNLAAQTLGLAMVTAQVATLVRYPDGVAMLAVERLLVGGLGVLAVALPALLLLTRPEVVPTWVLAWSAGSDGLDVPTVASPWSTAGAAAPAWVGAAVRAVDGAVLSLGPLLGVAVAALRYRRLDAARRRRTAWPLFAGLLLVLGAVVNALAERGALPHLVGEAVYIACHVLLPVAIGLGIAAPGVFDALGAVRRTVPFAVLSLLVLGSYVAAASLLGIAASGQDLRVAVVVAVIAALALEPVRRSLVRRAERLAFGHGLSRDDLLLRLGDALEHTMDRRALAVSVAETAREGLGVQWVALQPRGEPAVHVGRPARPGEEPAMTSRLLHGHEDLGTLSCGPPVGAAARSRSRSQLDTLARQVAMALTSSRLATELAERLAEVDASRQRLVTAEESVRRRLERDLHDGAQQDLAVLLARVALARRQLGRAEVDQLDATLATLQSDAGDALSNLRELASGIHETTLADQGLVAAVESRVIRLPIPVQLRCGPGVRDGTLAAAAASAAYFTVCEALANVLKHSGARGATVEMVLRDGQLQIDVTDDGRGFDPQRAGGATGLTGLRDRVAAVGGTLAVRSAPGSGTALTAVVPAEP